MTYLERVKAQLTSSRPTLQIVEGGITYSGAQILSGVEAHMANIATWGVAPGSRIAMLPQRSIEWVYFMYAAMFSGLVPLLIDANMDDETLKKMITDEVRVFGEVSRSVGDLHIEKLPIVVHSSEYKGLLRCAQIDATQSLFTAHTSGTTGIPKKITYNNTNINWAVDEYERIYGFDNPSMTTVLFSLPYHYCYSVIPCCIVPFALGKKIVIASENSSTVDIAELIQNERVQILVVNPVFYTGLSRIGLERFNFSSLRLCDSGGESIPPSIVRSIKAQTDVLITEGYGLTETTSLTHFLLPDDNGELRIGSVGRACRGVEARIVDNGEIVLKGAIGELQVRGPMLAPYDEIALNDDVADNWFATGDLFYEDPDGFFYFVSRKKDVPRVSPEEVLSISRASMDLLDYEGVQDVSFVFNEHGAPLIFLVTDTTQDKEVFSKKVIETFPKSLRANVELRYVAALPRTSTGKVRKRDL